MQTTMEQLTDYDAEQYITSHAVSFMAQSRPFGGVKSPNGMRRFFSDNVTTEQRALISNTSKVFANSAISYLKNTPAGRMTNADVIWMVVFNWNYRLCIVNEKNRSQYTDIMKAGDPMTLAVIKRAKAANVFFDLSGLEITASEQVHSIHN